MGGSSGGGGLAIGAEFLGLLDDAEDDLDEGETQLVLDYVGAVEAVDARDSHHSILHLKHLFRLLIIHGIAEALPVLLTDLLGQLAELTVLPLGFDVEVVADIAYALVFDLAHDQLQHLHQPGFLGALPGEETEQDDDGGVVGLEGLQVLQEDAHGAFLVLEGHDLLLVLLEGPEQGRAAAQGDVGKLTALAGDDGLRLYVVGTVTVFVQAEGVGLSA